MTVPSRVEGDRTDEQYEHLQETETLRLPGEEAERFVRATMRPAWVGVGIDGLQELQVDRHRKDRGPDKVRPVGDAGDELPAHESRKPQGRARPQSEQRRPEHEAVVDQTRT